MSTTLAEHYADALASVAIERNAAGQIRRELADFMGLLRESADLGVVLNSPAVPRETKHAVIHALMERMGAGKTMQNFLYVILDRRRMALLREIQQAFDAQLDAREGITRAEVISTRELGDAEKAQLRGALEHISGGRVDASYQINPALIAGTVVRIGSTVYDGSVRMQLDRLRARMSS